MPRYLHSNSGRTAPSEMKKLGVNVRSEMLCSGIPNKTGRNRMPPRPAAQRAAQVGIGPTQKALGTNRNIPEIVQRRWVGTCERAGDLESE